MTSEVLEALVAGLAVGLAVALPPGAVALLIVDVGLRHGARPALAAGAGAATADAVYAGVAGAAGAGIADALTAHRAALDVTAGVVLLLVAAHLAWGAGRRPVAAAAEPPPRPAAVYARLVAVTLANPSTIVAFAAVAVVVAPSGAHGVVALAAGAGAGSLAWQSVLAVLGGVLGSRVGEERRRRATVAGAALVAALGLRTLLGA